MMKMTRGAVTYPGAAVDIQTGSWRDHRPVHNHRPAPCHGACPAGEDPQAYIAKLQEGDARAAWEILASVNPLPSVTGRVCPHPCETACNRGQLDSDIAIHGIERYLGDEGIAHGWTLPPPPLARDAPRIAVVGAGPAGLSAAYHLRRRGFGVDLFDRETEAGGLLRSAIADFRLPKDVLDAELERIFVDGIKFHPHTVLGRDMRLDELARTYPAFFVAVGCRRSRPWSVDGATPDDLHEGLALLEEWGNVGEMPAKGRKAVVHGGGNTAVDVARLLLWCGAEEAHVVTASALSDDPEAAPEDRMSAIAREVMHAKEEGVIFHPHHTISHLALREGRVVAVELSALRKLPDADGHVRRVSFEGTETVIEADLVVPALGEMVDPLGLESMLNSRGFVETDAVGRLPDHAAGFAGGDMTGRGGMVTMAIGDGRRAAESIERLLGDRELAATPTPAPIGFDELHTAYFERVPREEPPVVATAERDPRTEIEGRLSDSQIARETRRCLSCGNCLACDNCWTVCPDSAVLKTREIAADGSHYVFDYDFCKGCGLCAHECPPGYIAMIEEHGPAA